MIKKNVLIEAIHQGVLDALESFEFLSHGLWIADQRTRGAEGFLVSKIFLAINEYMEEDENLIVELPFGYIKEWAEADKRGRPSQESRRVDIGLFNKKGNPIHVIEVKRRWDEGNCEEDIEKLKYLLRAAGPRRGGSMKSGYLSVCWQRKNRPYLKEKMDEVEQFVLGLGIGEGVNVNFYRKIWSIEKDGKKSQYGSHVIELSRKYKKTT